MAVVEALAESFALKAQVLNQLRGVRVGAPVHVALAFGSWPATTKARSLAPVFEANATLVVTVNGRPYRGTIVALRDRTGVTVVDRLPMESYLVGVVSAEMGRRSPEDQEALRALALD